MTATLTAPGIDLSWVTFTPDEPWEKCGALATDCPAEAVAAAWWKHTCRCAPARQPLCVEHRDNTARKAAEGGLLFACPRCDSPCLLLRIEPIR